MNRIIFILTLSAFLFSQQAEVTNIQAAQRTDGSQIVDITYDLSEDVIFEFFEVTVEVSLDGGSSYQSMGNVSGDLGSGITAGSGKVLTWNYGQQFNETYSDQIKIRINATSNAVIIDNSQELPFDMITIPSEDDYYYCNGGNPLAGTCEWELASTLSFYPGVNIDYDYEIMKNEVTDYDYIIYLLDIMGNDTNSDEQICGDNDAAVEPLSCASAVSEFGCEFMWGGTALCELCPGSCPECCTYFGDMNINSTGVWGLYPGDGGNPAGAYLYLSFGGSKISWNGEIFELEEGFINHPVTGVTWIGAWAFATHYGMQLPTNSEWQKASRGMNQYIYPWGNEISDENANFSGSGDPFDDNTTPIGSYNGQQIGNLQTIDSPSPYGLYDMTGNVAEYLITGSAQGQSMGGSYSADISSSFLSTVIETTQSSPTGFRCVRILND